MIDFLHREHAQLTAIRRELHAHPELSLQECWTAQFVASTLRRYGISVVESVGGHGLVGVVEGSAPGPGVAIRADMDALPIKEETGLAYASRREGIMHACGHDGHMAIVIGAGATLAHSRDFRGTVYLYFQPAEEQYGGAQMMIEEGILDRFPSRNIFGIHNWPDLPAGELVVHDGPVMAGASDFDVTFHAEGGHAAIPNFTGDPVLSAGHFLTGLQQAVARAVSPFDHVVAGVTMIAGGNSYNIIPEVVRLQGTLRAFDMSTIELLQKRLLDIAGAAARIANSQESVEFLKPSMPPVINTPHEAGLMREAARLCGVQYCEEKTLPAMTGDDFGVFLKHLPGAYAWIGNGLKPGSVSRLHQAEYDFNDSIIPTGARMLAETARLALLA